MWILHWKLSKNIWLKKLSVFYISSEIFRGTLRSHLIQVPRSGFDNRVRWSEHLAFLEYNIRNYIYAFRQLSEILVHGVIISEYYVYTQSLVTLGTIAWGGDQKIILSLLIIIQKPILKVELIKSNRFPSDSIFREPNVLAICQLLMRNLVVYLWNVLGQFLRDFLTLTTTITLRTYYQRI